jgi:hypothetical protein
MPQKMLHVRIPASLEAQLSAFCQAYNQSASDVVRGALAYVLDKPSLYGELCARPVPTVFEEIRSPEQIAAYVEYEKQMQDFDMGTIVRECGLA